MKIEIDQSGKIENTNRLTVVAFSNAKDKSLLISAKDKKSIQSVYRKIGQPKIFILKLFAVAIFFLVKDDIERINQITIDREYFGHENLIRCYLVEIIKKNKLSFDSKFIHFKSIGRSILVPII